MSRPKLSGALLVRREPRTPAQDLSTTSNHADENARRGIRFSLKPNPSRVSSQPRQNQNNSAPAVAPAPSSDPALQTASQSQT